jgi:hypothetical protein
VHQRLGIRQSNVLLPDSLEINNAKISKKDMLQCRIDLFPAAIPTGNQRR